MQCLSWENRLVIRLAIAVAEALKLKEADLIEIRVAGEPTLEVSRNQSRRRAPARLRNSLAAWLSALTATARVHGRAFQTIIAALQFGCTTLHREDMPAGQVIDRRLTIHTPSAR